MRRESFDIARCSTGRLKKDICGDGVVCSKKPKTTIPGKVLPCPLCQVKRQFNALVPNFL